MQAIDSIRAHYPEYLMEAAGLGAFMVSAGLFATLLWHPDSPASFWITGELFRRSLMGIAMGVTAVGLIYSPWGKRSGAHLNPAVTLTMLRMKKIAPWDACFYIVSQIIGGLLGLMLIAFMAGRLLDSPPIWYVTTVPGEYGALAAFIAEFLISGGLLLAVISAAESQRFKAYAGVIAGVLLALYITIEAPISGMSINPARTIASAIPSGIYDSLWIYLTGPVLGMLVAAELFRLVSGRRSIACCGLNHQSVLCRIFQAGREHWNTLERPNG